MLQMVFRLHTHHLWNAKTSGDVRNVSIIVDGTKGCLRGQLSNMGRLALLVGLVVGQEAGEVGQGLFGHSCARIGETWLINSTL